MASLPFIARARILGRSPSLSHVGPRVRIRWVTGFPEGANAEPCQPWRHPAGIEPSFFRRQHRARGRTIRRRGRWPDRHRPGASRGRDRAARVVDLMQAPTAPGGVERGPLQGTGDFPGIAMTLSTCSIGLTANTRDAGMARASELEEFFPNLTRRQPRINLYAAPSREWRLICAEIAGAIPRHFRHLMNPKRMRN
jgi:hypothetical protein